MGWPGTMPCSHQHLLHQLFQIKSILFNDAPTPCPHLPDMTPGQQQQQQRTNGQHIYLHSGRGGGGGECYRRLSFCPSGRGSLVSTSNNQLINTLMQSYMMLIFTASISINSARSLELNEKCGRCCWCTLVDVSGWVE